MYFLGITRVCNFILILDVYMLKSHELVCQNGMTYFEEESKDRNV